MPLHAIPTQRRLFGRKGYFPAKRGPSRATYPFAQRPSQAPAGFTLPEWNVFLAHETLKLKEHQDFDRQWWVGAIGQQAARVDFMEHDVQVAIEIQGLFYHYIGFDGMQVQNDMQRKINLEGHGLTVVFIDEDDANADPVYYLAEARAGQDHSRVGRGLF